MLLKEKIIRVISIVFISIMFLLFGGRTVYYYLNYKGINFFENKKELTLMETITDIKNITNGDTGLVRAEKGYLFIGKADNNYLYFSGQLWRIMSISEEGNLTLVLDVPITALNYSGEYENSSLVKWLNDSENGVFLNSLKNSDQLLENSVCIDNMDEATIKEKNHACSLYSTKNKVGVLDIKQYLQAGSSNSYLSGNHVFWLANGDDRGGYWFVSDTGGFNNNSDDKILGVKPTITISGDVLLKSGTGVKRDPYFFEDKEITKLSDAMVGDFVEYSETQWRIAAIEEGRVKLVMDSYMDTETYSFSDKTGAYNPTNKKSLAYYLNNDFLETLDDELIVEGSWSNGIYSFDTDYNYLKIREKKVMAKVGLLNIGDMYLLDWASSHTMTQNLNYEPLYTIFSVNDKYGLFIDKPTGKHKVRPAIYVDSEAKIYGGLGLFGYPYQLEKYEE